MYSNSRSTTKTSNKKKILYTALGIFVAAILVIAVLELTGTTNLLTNNDSSVSEDDKFNQPPTEQEASAGDEVPIKQESEDAANEPNDNETGQGNSQATPVALIISDIGVYDGNVEVSAFTPDAIANGTCTYTFTSGSETVTKTNLARADASSSICIDQPFPASELSASDEWGVGITYESESGNYTGTQQTVLQL